MATFTVQLTAEQITYIGQALSSKPYGEVVGLVQSIQRQVDEQLSAQSSDGADRVEPDQAP